MHFSGGVSRPVGLSRKEEWMLGTEENGKRSPEGALPRGTWVACSRYSVSMRSFGSHSMLTEYREHATQVRDAYPNSCTDCRTLHYLYQSPVR